MAKLSARGRTEQHRFSKVTREQRGTNDIFDSTRYISIMSDGHILRKTTWRNSIGKLEGTPWNNMGRCDNVTSYIEKLTQSGYSPPGPPGQKGGDSDDET